MARERTYHVVYNMNHWEALEKGVDVVAENKFVALEKATYEVIPNIEDAYPYSAYVESVTYSNGKYRKFLY